MPSSVNKQLWLLKTDDIDFLFGFFDKNKTSNSPKLLWLIVEVLHRLSRQINNDVLLFEHKESILEIFHFLCEEEITLFDTTTIAKIYNALSKWPSLIDNFRSLDLVDFFLPYIKKRARDFNSRNSATILNFLSKCIPPLTDSFRVELFKNAIDALLTNFPDKFSPEDSVSVTLAVCYFDFKRLLDFSLYQPKLLELFNELDPKALDLFTTNKLHQIFIYKPELLENIIIKKFISVQFFINFLESYVTSATLETSRLHESVFSVLESLYPNKFVNEYKLGHTFVDIASSEAKLCIQVNGPTHYRGEGDEVRLNDQSQFTNNLLMLQGWTVIIVNYTEWPISNQDRGEFLRELLNSFIIALPEEKKFIGPPIQQQMYSYPWQQPYYSAEQPQQFMQPKQWMQQHQFMMQQQWMQQQQFMQQQQWMQQQQLMMQQQQLVQQNNGAAMPPPPYVEPSELTGQLNNIAVANYNARIGFFKSADTNMPSLQTNDFKSPRPT